MPFRLTMTLLRSDTRERTNERKRDVSSLIIAVGDSDSVSRWTAIKRAAGFVRPNKEQRGNHWSVGRKAETKAVIDDLVSVSLGISEAEVSFFAQHRRKRERGRLVTGDLRKA